ncbi:MAG: damage-inducible protein DinB, partial [Rhodobacteraceae bacterium]|nr:damage-inducible protein DinB [Paracoccaceae bacterium]
MTSATPPAAAPLVTPAYMHTMAAYNAAMNRRLYDAAARLSAQDRVKDRGAFWGSIHRTLAHILWGDQTWMSRFDGWPKPAAAMQDGPDAYPDFAELTRVRADADTRIIEWANRVTPAWLAEDLVWFSGAAQREIRMNKSLLVTHFFNHQTHHR